MHINLNRPSAQAGSALILSLVILTIITVSALVAMQRSTLQLRMVSSMQRNQEVFNATYSYLSQGYFLMRQDLNSTKSILSKLIDDETLSINPFAANSWATPSTSNVVKAVGGTLSTSSLGGYSAQISSRYLKGNEGTGGSTETTYYFTFQATGSDASGQITSTQEIGISYAAPTLE